VKAHDEVFTKFLEVLKIYPFSNLIKSDVDFSFFFFLAFFRSFWPFSA